MAMFEFIGYCLIAFGCPLAIFLTFIMPDPMRIILFIGGAFMYLASILCTAVLWFIIPPLDQYIVLTVLLFVMFQELFRYAYYVLLSKAKAGLDKVTVRGQPIVGVHPLKNANHVIAFVAGLGFGAMAGVMASLNLLAAIAGPATVGLPTGLGLTTFHGDHKFFLYSMLCVGALILLHTMWNVVFACGCFTRSWGMIVIVLVSHIFCACVSLLNQKNYQIITLVFFYGLLIAFTAAAYVVSGGSKKGLQRFAIKITASVRKGRQPDVVNVRL